jgi:hypothetical protein
MALCAEILFIPSGPPVGDGLDLRISPVDTPASLL